MNFFIYSVRALKGERGKDIEIFAPVGITVTSDDGRKLGMFFFLNGDAIFTCYFLTEHFYKIFEFSL